MRVLSHVTLLNRRPHTNTHTLKKKMEAGQLQDTCYKGGADRGKDRVLRPSDKPTGGRLDTHARKKEVQRENEQLVRSRLLAERACSWSGHSSKTPNLNGRHVLTVTRNKATGAAQDPDFGFLSMPRGSCQWESEPACGAPGTSGVLPIHTGQSSGFSTHCRVTIHLH